MQKGFPKALFKSAGSIPGEERMRAHLTAACTKIFSNVSLSAFLRLLLLWSRVGESRILQGPCRQKQLLWCTLQWFIRSWGCIKAVLLARGMLAKAPWLYSSAMGLLGSTRADTVHFELLLPLKHNAANSAVPPHSGCHSAFRLCQRFWSSTANQRLLRISRYQILMVQCHPDTNERKTLSYKKLGKLESIYIVRNDPVLLSPQLLRKLHMSFLLTPLNNLEITWK